MAVKDEDKNTCNCTWIDCCTCGATKTTELEETAEGAADKAKTED